MTYRSGLIILAFSLLLSSFNGLIIRLSEGDDPWAAVIGRYLAQAVGMAAWVAWTSRGRPLRPFLAMGWPGLAGGVCYGLASVGFIFALSLTTIAETMFALSMAPVVTAVAARLVLGEKVRPTAWIAMAGSTAGIAIMFGGGGGGGSTLGLVAALLCVLFNTGFVLGLRWGRALDMMPTISVGSLVAGLIGLVVAPGAVAAMPVHDLVLFACWGGLLATLFSVLFVMGSRVVPGGEMMLFIFVEVVLAPFWVWLLVGEEPARSTLLGGAVVIASVAVFAWAGLRRGPVVAPDSAR